MTDALQPVLHNIHDRLSSIEAIQQENAAQIGRLTEGLTELKLLVQQQAETTRQQAEVAQQQAEVARQQAATIQSLASSVASLVAFLGTKDNP